VVQVLTVEENNGALLHKNNTHLGIQPKLYSAGGDQLTGSINIIPILVKLAKDI